MRSFHIVVSHEGRSDSFGVLQIGRPLNGQTLFLVGAIVAFDEAILLRMMSSTDLDLDAQTGDKADQGRGKITALRTTDPAGITIQGNTGWSSIACDGAG